MKIDYLPFKLGLAVANITKELSGPDFQIADSALQRFLDRQKGFCVLLIDSIEQYRLNDRISSAVIAALIETVRILYGERFRRRIIAKAAFPSEIYPKLTVINRGKVEGKNLFILWRYKDLVCMLVKRYYQKLSKGENSAKLRGLDDYRNAQKLLHNYLPEKIITWQSISFDTISYIIRHTQKKPRQVIL